MHQLVLPNELHRSLRADMLRDVRFESLAVVFAGRQRRAGGYRLLAREYRIAAQSDYRVREAFHLEMDPRFWATVAKRARATGESPVVVHTHPHDPGIPRFSPSDDWGEGQLVPKLRARAPVPIGTLVVSPGGSDGRLHDRGPEPLVLSSPWPTRLADGSAPIEPPFERQVLALGASGHARLRSLTVAVVGAGGTGSQVAQQLIHLGVGELLVVDPDHVEPSNLSRLVGAVARDAEKHVPKTRVVARLARQVRTGTRVREVRASAVLDRVAQQLTKVDVVFGCTDTQWSRTVLNAIAHQHFVPVIDIGVELRSTGGLGGRVTILGPDQGCLWCLGLLDEERVRGEQLGPAEYAAQRTAGYVSDLDVPEPAVVSINGVVASLAVTEFVDRVTGFRGGSAPANMLLYRLSDGTVRRVSVAGRSCPACSGAIRGAGDLAALPTVNGHHDRQPIAAAEAPSSVQGLEGPEASPPCATSRSVGIRS